MKFESLKSLRLKGSGKFLHKLFLALTYPLRHSFKFLILVFVVSVIFVAIPMTQGVSYKHVFDWYLLRYNETSLAKKVKNNTIPELAERKLKNKYKKEFKFKETAAPDIRHVSDIVKRKMNNKNVNKTENVKRKTFKLSASPFKHANVKNTWNRKNVNKTENIKTENIKTEKQIDVKPEEDIKLQEDIITVEEININQPIQAIVDPLVLDEKEIVVELPKIDTQVSYRKLDTLPLNYEDNPAKISGKTIVYTANEISVNNTYIILYGLYTNPEKHDVQEAFTYLRELISDHEVECEIVAYTYQHFATGLCYIEGKSINHNLVDAGFADNIAL